MEEDAFHFFQCLFRKEGWKLTSFRLSLDSRFIICVHFTSATVSSFSLDENLSVRTQMEEFNQFIMLVNKLNLQTMKKQLMIVGLKQLYVKWKYVWKRDHFIEYFFASQLDLALLAKSLWSLMVFLFTVLVMPLCSYFLVCKCNPCGMTITVS